MKTCSSEVWDREYSWSIKKGFSLSLLERALMSLNCGEGGTPGHGAVTIVWYGNAESSEGLRKREQDALIEAIFENHGKVLNERNAQWSEGCIPLWVLKEAVEQGMQKPRFGITMPTVLGITMPTMFGRLVGSSFLGRQTTMEEAVNKFELKRVTGLDLEEFKGDMGAATAFLKEYRRLLDDGVDEEELKGALDLENFKGDKGAATAFLKEYRRLLDDGVDEEELKGALRTYTPFDALRVTELKHLTGLDLENFKDVDEAAAFIDLYRRLGVSQDDLERVMREEAALQSFTVSQALVAMEMNRLEKTDYSDITEEKVGLFLTEKAEKARKAERKAEQNRLDRERQAELLLKKRPGTARAPGQTANGALQAARRKKKGPKLLQELEDKNATELLYFSDGRRSRNVMMSEKQNLMNKGQKKVQKRMNEVRKSIIDDELRREFESSSKEKKEEISVKLSKQVWDALTQGNVK